MEIHANGKNVCKMSGGSDDCLLIKLQLYMLVERNKTKQTFLRLCECAMTCRHWFQYDMWSQMNATIWNFIYFSFKIAMRRYSGIMLRATIMIPSSTHLLSVHSNAILHWCHTRFMASYTTSNSTRIAGLFEDNSPVTTGFPSQSISNAESASLT